MFSAMRNPEKEAIVGQPVVLEFERMELNREKLRELIVAECQHYRDIRNATSAQATPEATGDAAAA